MLEYLHQKHMACKIVMYQCSVPAKFFIVVTQALFNYFVCYCLDFLALALNSTSTSYSGDYTLMVWKFTNVSIFFSRKKKLLYYCCTGCENFSLARHFYS